MGQITANEEINIKKDCQVEKKLQLNLPGVCNVTFLLKERCCFLINDTWAQRAHLNLLLVYDYFKKTKLPVQPENPDSVL